jgi:type IV secretion system protein VirD4
MKFVMLIAISLGFLLLAKWAWIPSRKLPGNRIRHQRIRLHLRLHPGRGHATVAELWWHWGKWSVLRQSKRARPDLSYWTRLRHPREHSVFVGRAHYRHALRILAEIHTLIMSPPRKGKTAWLARMILRFPGALVCTSVKDDLFRLTSGIREKFGQIHVFNPEGIGGVLSTFAINPVAGCEVKAVAIRRAQSLCNATDTSNMKDADFFKAKAAQMLEAMLYAAALLHSDLRLIARWVFTSAEEAQQTLFADNSSEMAAALNELHNSPAEKTAGTIRMVLSQVLGFLTDPALAMSVLPAGDGGFDIDQFIRSRGTLYMIASGDHETSPLAPLFALIVGEIKHHATLIAQATGRGRLTRPLGMFLDEITQIVPVPLDKWLASVGGLGIQIFTVVHGVAQLRKRWGREGAQVILDTSDLKIFLPGITDAETLDSAEKVCGKVSLQQQGHGRDKEREYYAEHPVMDMGMVRSLPRGCALIIRGERSPVLAHLPRVWNAPEYRWAKWHGRAVATLQPAHAVRAVPEPVKVAGRAPELVPAGSVDRNGQGQHAYPWSGPDGAGPGDAA